MKPIQTIIQSHLLLVVLLLTGRAVVGPDYRPPELEMPAKWHTPTDPAILPDAKIVRQWWTLYRDPMLDRLIKAASATNLDLLTADARVEETRSRLGIATGKRYPTVDAFSSVIRQRSSENSVGTGDEETVYTPGIGASWEIDLFGRIQRSVEAATLRFRPILMTAATFILGVFPLVVATGAGAAGRQALGTAVFSGMISATALLIFFVPVFYYSIQRASEGGRKQLGIGRKPSMREIG